MRLPEFSQPLVTAFQLAILAVMKDCGLICSTVIGHSSGEIAAATAANYLTPEQAIKIAYYRGKAVSEIIQDQPVGMLAVGIGVNKVLPYLIGVADVEIACKNSPESVTLAGDRKELETLQKRIKSDGHFARLLLVDAAYHSKYMRVIAPRYTEYIEKCCKLSFQDKKSVTMYSSVTGLVLEKEIGQPKYWVDNMTSPVLFQQATQEMLQQEHLDMVVEIGPSDALSGPFKQIMNATSTSVQYASTWKRCEDPLAVFCTLAGNLFLQGAPISLAKFNGDFEGNKPTVLVDLPNYSWNHTTKYWHESDSSKDWRFPNFPHHDLLGSKVLGTPWYQPTWKKAIRLEELPWLRDHMLGENVVFPAAGYVAMATEAVFQMHTSLGNIAPNTQIQQISYRIRDLSIERAMVLEDDGAETKVTLVMNPIAGTKNDWYRFRISSQVNRVINDYCHGSISIMGNVEIVANEADMRPLEHGDPAKYWYKTMQDLGYCYGPGFRTQLAVESRAGQRRSRSIISLTAPKSSIRQSEYPIHPASIDGCFQSVGAPLWQGNRSAVNQALLPAGADEILICAHNPALKSGIAISTAVFEAPGREDDAKSYKANVSLYNDDDGKLLFQMSGLRTHSLQNDGANMVPHTYCRLRWEPDISLLSQAQLNVLLDSSIYSTSSDAKLQDSLLNRVLDLFAFKKPDLKIKEIDMSEKEGNLWIDMRKSEVFDRMRGCQYQYSVMTHDAQSRASIKYGEFGNATIKIMGDTEAFEEEEKFDLIIVSLPPQTAKQSLVIPYILSQLESDGALVMLNRSCNDTKQVLIKGNCFPPSGASKVFPDGLIQEIQNAGFRRSLLIHPNCSAGSSQVRREYALAFAPTDIKVASTETDLVHVLHFLQDWTSTETLCDSLQSNGLKASPHSIPPTGLAQGSIVLVLDELYSPVLSDTNEKQWEALQYLVKLECRILWVTKGCQMQVTDPQRSLFLGLARSICEENPNLVMMTLDVEGLHEEVTASAIGAILKRLKTAVPGECVDKEFVERSNVIHIGRVVPDIVINDTEQGVTVMQEPNSCSLFESQATIRLISSRVGTLDSLLWAESSQIDTCLPDGHVEVEVHAVGINFKDIAVTMGLVPADECKLGLEGAGIIRRLGKDAGNLKVGQRVLINKKGALANKICCEAIGEVFPIPDWLSFEDASTVCIVYSTVFYALLDLANVCEGQSVLIHSGAGGVGLAAIQLCKYLGVTIYATVGTDEKRKFLVEECGIPPTHIFSSRTTEFATSVLKVTNGNGVNCVLNSLSGEGLHESWRCIATGGVFVEIGKKDILENSSLSMGPFVRNASFRAVDMSHDSFDSKFKHKLLERIFELLEKRHIKPIHIGKTFGFENVVDSFRYMRGGLNIGKTVICREPAKNTIVPVSHHPP
jgi:acyl transferase domain-containing protein/NADPH:quinone reductase-like Zn-dependent oxidoreductase